MLKFTYPKFKNGEATVRDMRISLNFGECTVRINSASPVFFPCILGYCETFRLSSVVRVSSFHISVQIKVEMHSSKNMPAGEDIAMLQFTLSWCMIRENELYREK